MARYPTDIQHDPVPEFAEVQPGENYQLFCERHGVHPDRVIELNRQEMTDHARSRGFDVGFMRAVPDQDGGAFHESGQRVRFVPDYHVFAGQRLRLRLPEQED